LSPVTAGFVDAVGLFAAGCVDPSVSVFPRCRTGRLGSVSFALGELALGTSSGAGGALAVVGPELVSEGDGALLSGGEAGGGEAGGAAGGVAAGGSDFA